MQVQSLVFLSFQVLYIHGFMVYLRIGHKYDRYITPDSVVLFPSLRYLLGDYCVRDIPYRCCLENRGEI